MNRIELKINDDKSMEVVTPQPLVEGENLTTEISVEIPASWAGSAIRALITTPMGKLVDAVDASVPIPLTNTMLDGKGTLYVEYVAMKDGAEIARTKSPALLPVSAARSIIGDIDPAPLPDLVAEMVAAKGGCEDAAAAAVLAKQGIETTDAEVQAAEAIRETDEQDRKEAEEARAGFYDGFNVGITDLSKALEDTIHSVFDVPKNGKKIVMIGDSITNGTEETKTQPWFWLGVFTNYNHVIINKGVGGNTTTQMLARFSTDVIALNPDIVIINGGKNNIGDSATVFSDIKKMVALAEIAGIEPILSSVIQYGNVSGGPVYTDFDKAQTIKVNNLIKDYAAESGIKFVDFYASIVDPVTGYTADRYINSDDNMHPVHLGVVKLVDALLPLFYMGNIDDVLYSPQGNLISNADFLSDTNSDGVPDFWAGTANGAAIGTCQIIPTNKGNCVKISMTSNPANNYSISTTCPVHSGEVLEFSADIMTQNTECDPNINYLYGGVKVHAYDTVTWNEQQLINAWKAPLGKWVRIRKSFTVPAGVTVINVVLGIRYSKSGDLYVRRPLLKKIN